MILVDSNIPMYLVGAPHPHKADAQRLLEKLPNGVTFADNHNGTATLSGTPTANGIFGISLTASNGYRFAGDTAIYVDGGPSSGHHQRQHRRLYRGHVQFIYRDHHGLPDPNFL